MQKGIGKRIRDARKAAGLTQEELAERMGTSSVAVAQWETGRRNPKMGTVSKLAAALGVDVAELVPELKTLLKEKPEPPPMEPIFEDTLYLMKDNNQSWNGQALQMERIRQSQKATTEAVNAMLWEKLKAQENICACQEREIYLLKRKVQNEQEKAETSKAIADQKIAVLTQRLEKKKRHRTLGDRVLQMIGFWVGIIYWLENMDRS